MTRHQEKPHYALRCECGYAAHNPVDLQEHIDIMIQYDTDDEEQTQ
jgi:hypothetical protein